MQVTPTRFRVPDVVVFDRQRPIQQMQTHPPIAVFEGLSPEDSILGMMIKLADYESMGMRNIFVLDPKLERTYRYASGSLHTAQPSEPLTNSARQSTGRASLIYATRSVRESSAKGA